jgi:hypothetical protein
VVVMTEVVTVYQLSSEIVDYVIEHWSDYVVNIRYPFSVKLTEKQIVEIICKKHPSDCETAMKKRFHLNGVLSTLYTVVLYEFEKRGYKVEKKRLGGNRTALYIHKA